MDLLIDVQALQSPATHNRGVDRYTRNLVAELADIRPEWRLELVQNGGWAAINGRLLGKLPVRTFRPPLPSVPEHQDANERYYADWLTAQAPDTILLANCFDHQALVPHFVGDRPPLFGIVYDLIPLLFHERYLATGSSLSAYAGRWRRVLAMDGILVISQVTAKDLRKLAGNPLPPVTTIGGAADGAFVPHEGAELKKYWERFQRRFGLRRDFILYVGGFDFRKNLQGAMESFADLPDACRQRLDLVIVCQLDPAHREQVEHWARELAIADSLKLTGYVSDEELRALYGLCRLFFFPSLYEGLGLPVLEALRCGAPVVASNRSSIPEVAGTVSWLVDPATPVEVAATIVTALNEPRAANRTARIEQSRRFTWRRSAELAARALEATCPQPSGSGRRRVAWVSPLPPSATGVADYSAELLRDLASYFDIELVVDAAEPPVGPELSSRHLVLTSSEARVRHEANPFDLFVYQVGNSPRHVYMLDLMQRYRGLVVLHDYFLGGLLWPAVQTGFWPTTLDRELEWEGATKLAQSLRAERIGAREILNQVPLNRRLLSLAEAVLVHSAWSLERVRQLVSVPVTRVPMLAPMHELMPRAQERSRLGLPQNRFLIATLGVVAPHKRINSLLRAVAALPAAMRSESLVLIVGPATADQEGEALSLARRLGLGSSVRLTGRVPLGDLAAYARAADVCVQLRYPSHGETSASLLRELGTGAACIISDQGSIAEIPDNVVVKVRTPDHEITDLTAGLAHLHSHREIRDRLGQAAVRFITRHHDRRQVVERYVAAIEAAADRRERDDVRWLESACDALLACGDSVAATKLAETWSALRHQGQHKRRNR
jgi:glycosyltransferase involved in cell wall biosynthesis